MVPIADREHTNRVLSQISGNNGMRPHSALRPLGHQPPWGRSQWMAASSPPRSAPVWPPEINLVIMKGNTLRRNDWPNYVFSFFLNASHSMIEPPSMAAREKAKMGILMVPGACKFSIPINAPRESNAIPRKIPSPLMMIEKKFLTPCSPAKLNASGLSTCSWCCESMRESARWL